MRVRESIRLHGGGRGMEEAEDSADFADPATGGQAD